VRVINRSEVEEELGSGSLGGKGSGSEEGVGVEEGRGDGADGGSGEGDIVIEWGIGAWDQGCAFGRLGGWEVGGFKAGRG
jgi:hypothetical protein